jgi:sporulation protein YunB
MKSKSKKTNKNHIIVYNLHLKQKIFAIFTIIVLFVFLYVKFLAMPLVEASTKTQISAYATNSLNLAVADVMKTGTEYSDLVNIVRDSANEISHIEANSILINSISKRMTKSVLEKFLTFSKTPIQISSGAFTGISVLTGSGVKVEFDVRPYGEVFTDFKSRFESAGINQTYHKLYMVLSITVNAVLPFKTISVSNGSEVLLCETLVVGKIPDVYLNSGSLTEMLNLVPEKFSS